MEAFEDKVRRGGATAMETVDKFFQKEDEVHVTLRDIVGRLNALGLPYAVAGGLPFLIERPTTNNHRTSAPPARVPSRR